MPELFDTIGEKAGQLAPPSNVNTVDADNAEDDEVQAVEQIESLCMNCHENGTTRLLLTKIPFFREVVLMSFACEHCGFHDNQIQPAGTIQLKGTHYELRLTALPDFQRQVVKSDTATVKFIELDLEVPAGRGQLTNVEGILTTIVEDLEAGQEARREQSPEVYEKVGEVIAKAHRMLAGGAFPFRLSVDDPTGNSFIAPDPRDGVGKWERRDYTRTPEQNAELGLADTVTTGLDVDGNIVPDQVYQFPATCPGCMHPCTTNMKMVDVPHFRQVIIMNTTCDDCGYKSNDVKTGGEIPDKGKKTTLKVLRPEDLARDILKGESCQLECPELGLSVNPGTLGGRFTTVEGLLTQVRNDLHSQIFQTDDASATGGDSLATDERQRWTDFFAGLDTAIAGERPFTIVLTDPLAGSYVQSLADDPGILDDQITEAQYERTPEEDEELGLADMKVEDYEENNEDEGAKNTTASAAD